MIKNEWVYKVKDEENKKQFRIIITDSGREKYQSLNGASGKGDMDRFDPLKCLSDDEKQQLEKLISKVLKNL